MARGLMPHRAAMRTILRFANAAVKPFLVAWMLLFTVFAFSLIRENKQRIADIQESRVISCRQTYEGIREVFMPFFPPPEKRTPRQQGNLAKLDRTVTDLKERCNHPVNGGTP